MAAGMNIDVANQYLDELVRKVEAIVHEDQNRYLTTEVRNGRAEVELTLVDAARRTVSTYDLADKIRSQNEGTIPGGSFRVQAQSGLWILRMIFGSGGNEAVQVQLRREEI